MAMIDLMAERRPRREYLSLPFEPSVQGNNGAPVQNDISSWRAILCSQSFLWLLIKRQMYKTNTSQMPLFSTIYPCEMRIFYRKIFPSVEKNSWRTLFILICTRRQESWSRHNSSYILGSNAFMSERSF